MIKELSPANPVQVQKETIEALSGPTRPGFKNSGPLTYNKILSTCYKIFGEKPGMNGLNKLHLKQLKFNTPGVFNPQVFIDPYWFSQN